MEELGYIKVYLILWFEIFSYQVKENHLLGKFNGDYYIPYFQNKIIYVEKDSGGTHILRYTEMCRFNGSLFHKKSLNKGSIS